MSNDDVCFKTQFKDKIFSLSGKDEFEEAALELFNYQSRNCLTYKAFLHHLGVTSDSVNTLEEIPFLPIEMFKKHKVVTKPFGKTELLFRSSGTTKEQTSHHYVADASLYRKSLSKSFFDCWGAPSNYVFLALLPDYLERQDASLVWMVNELMKEAGNEESGFYLDNLGELKRKIDFLKEGECNLMLIGVSFALLDLAEQHRVNLGGHIVMETGGMKGRRKEMIREELHNRLKIGLGVNRVASEYGMTELLSQAYASDEGKFQFPNWAGVFVRDPYDPLSILGKNRTGGLNIIDLANIDSCAFIATDDIGIKRDENSFEVLGRFDNSDIRGCNLLFD